MKPFSPESPLNQILFLKVKLSVRLRGHSAMKANREVEEQLHALLYLVSVSDTKQICTCESLPQLSMKSNNHPINLILSHKRTKRKTEQYFVCVLVTDQLLPSLLVKACGANDVLLGFDAV
jgi:hypothetical protein